MSLRRPPFHREGQHVIAETRMSPRRPACHREGQHVTANARDQSQAIVLEIWMTHVANGPGTLILPCQYYSVFAPC